MKFFRKVSRTADEGKIVMRNWTYVNAECLKKKRIPLARAHSSAMLT
jgi:hypothetical protein